jgi:hypothetical protein
MPIRRRWLQFSFRTAFVLFTAFAVWLGVVVNRAHRQREAVRAIRELGGFVVYDWQLIETPQGWDFVGEPGAQMVAPHSWLRKIVGNDFFQKVKVVALPSMENSDDASIQKSIPYLQRLDTLRAIYFPALTTKKTLAMLKAELPNCEQILLDPTRL